MKGCSAWPILLFQCFPVFQKDRTTKKHGRTSTFLGPERVAEGWCHPRRVGPRRVGARTVGAQNFALFFPSPLTQADSDLEAAGVEERSQERGNTPRFEPWVGGTPSSPEDVAPLPAFPPPSVFVEEVPVHRHGDSETDLVGLVNIPNQFVQNEGVLTDDSDTESVAGSVRQEDTASVVEDPAEVAVPRAPALRHAFMNMDEVDVERIFSLRASVMRLVPRFLQGPFRNAMKMVEDVRVTHGWKVFLMLPRMLMHRPPGGGVISREKLVARFEAFTQGDWGRLMEASRICDEQVAQSKRRLRRRAQDDLELRAIRAERLVQVGELSSARQALEGAALAPGSQQL